jgi:hypothetical protein
VHPVGDGQICAQGADYTERAVKVARRWLAKGSFENRETIAGLVQATDLVICGTDNRQSKLLINELCVSANKPAVYGGAFRRAYGGQILRVRPKHSPCQQCFVSALPDEASDVEVSSQDEADAIAYSDRPVAVEPGLSLDVLPIAMQLAKVVLLELLADKSSTLNVLKRDFDAPWYLWLNRPESSDADIRSSTHGLALQYIHT